MYLYLIIIYFYRLTLYHINLNLTDINNMMKIQSFILNTEAGEIRSVIAGLHPARRICSSLVGNKLVVYMLPLTH